MSFICNSISTQCNCYLISGFTEQCHIYNDCSNTHTGRRGYSSVGNYYVFSTPNSVAVQSHQTEAYLMHACKTCIVGWLPPCPLKFIKVDKKAVLMKNKVKLSQAHSMVKFSAPKHIVKAQISIYSCHMMWARSSWQLLLCSKSEQTQSTHAGLDSSAKFPAFCLCKEGGCSYVPGTWNNEGN